MELSVSALKEMKDAAMLAKDESYYMFAVKRCPARNITHGQASRVICARIQKYSLDFLLVIIYISVLNL